MSVWGKMFGTTAKPKPKKSTGEDLNESIQKMRVAIEQLDKREKLVEKKMAAALATAKAKTKAGDKKTAMYHLKKKKQLEKQLDGIQGKKLNLETQILALEEAHMNAETLKAMSTGAKAMKRAVAETDIDKADDMMEEITEAMEGVQEMNEAMAAPLGMMDYDEDDLEAELAEFEEEAADEVLMDLDSADVEATSTIASLPSAPTKKVPKATAEEKEEAAVEEEFAELAAMMA